MSDTTTTALADRRADSLCRLATRALDAWSAASPAPVCPVPDDVRAAIPAPDSEESRRRSTFVALAAAVAAVDEFLSEVVDLGVEESQRDLLSAVPDQVDGFRELAELLALGRALEVRGLAGSGRDPQAGFIERFAASLHELPPAGRAPAERRGDEPTVFVSRDVAAALRRLRRQGLL